MSNATRISGLLMSSHVLGSKPFFARQPNGLMIAGRVKPMASARCGPSPPVRRMVYSDDCASRASA
jgi:hypothetical protein